MKYAIVLAMLLGAGGFDAKTWASEPTCSPVKVCSSADGCQPRGGWYPYGGGLFNWWPRCCFPSCGAPDNYCRKPLPCVCWPHYPSFYQFGSPAVCCAERSCNVAEGGAGKRHGIGEAPASLQ
jgi:hypothetical protein